MPASNSKYTVEQHVLLMDATIFQASNRAMTLNLSLSQDDKSMMQSQIDSLPQVNGPSHGSTKDFGKKSLLKNVFKILINDGLDDGYKRNELFRAITSAKESWLHFGLVNYLHGTENLVNISKAKLGASLKNAYRDSKKIYRVDISKNPNYEEIIFENARELDLLLYLHAAVMADDSLLPPKTKDRFVKWAEDKSIDLDNLPLPQPIKPINAVYSEEAMAKAIRVPAQPTQKAPFSKSKLMSGGGNPINLPGFGGDLLPDSKLLTSKEIAAQLATPESQKAGIEHMVFEGGSMLIGAQFIKEQEDRVDFKLESSPKEDRKLLASELDKYLDRVPQISNIYGNVLYALNQSDLTDQMKRQFLFRLIVRLKSSWIYGLDFKSAEGEKFTYEDFRANHAGEVLSKHWKRNSTGTTSNNTQIFDASKDLDLLPYLNVVLKAQDSVAPNTVKKDFEKWVAKHNIDFSKLPQPKPLELTKVYVNGVENDSQSNQTPPTPEDIIAQKQKWFNSIDVNDFVQNSVLDDNFSRQDYYKITAEINDIIPANHIDEALGASWRHIANSDVDADVKRLQFLMSLMGSNKRGTEHKKALGSGFLEQFGGDWYARAARLWKRPLKDMTTRNILFKAANDYGFIPELYFFLNADDSYAPDKSSGFLETWCAGHDVDLNEKLLAYKIQDHIQLVERLDVAETSTQSDTGKMPENVVEEIKDTKIETALDAEESESIEADEKSREEEKFVVTDAHIISEFGRTREKHPLYSKMEHQQVVSQYRNYMDNLNFDDFRSLEFCEPVFCNSSLDDNYKRSFFLIEIMRLKKSLFDKWGSTDKQYQADIEKGIARQFERNSKLQEELFDMVHSLDLTAYLNHVIFSDDSLLPEETRVRFQKWADDKGVDLQNLSRPESIYTLTAVYKEGMEPKTISIERARSDYMVGKILREGFSEEQLQAFDEAQEKISAQYNLDTYTDPNRILKAVSDPNYSDEMKRSIMYSHFFLIHPSWLKNTTLLDHKQNKSEGYSNEDREAIVAAEIAEIGANAKSFRKAVRRAVGQFAKQSNKSKLTNFFDKANELDLLLHLKIILEKREITFPKSTVKRFREWAREKDIDLNNLDMPAPLAPVTKIYAEGMEPVLAVLDDTVETETVEVANDKTPDALVVSEIAGDDGKSEGTESLDVPEIVTVDDLPSEEESDVPQEPEGDDLAELEADVRETFTINSPFIPKGIKVIDLEEVLYHGDGDEMLSIPSGERSNDNLPKEPEFRWHKMLNFLGDIGVGNHQIEAIYRTNDTHVIDLKTVAGRTQILVSDYSEIFIIRDQNFSQSKLPFYKSHSSAHKQNPDFDEESVEYLLDRADVWTFKLMSDDYAREELERHVFTRSEFIDEQAKHRVPWGNKGERLERSIIRDVMTTGKLPKTDDKSRIKEGALANVQGATYSKVNSALNRDATAKFKETGIKSIRAVWDNAVKDKPILKSFFNQASVDVGNVLASLQKITEKHGFVVEQEYFELMNEGDGILIAGCQAEKIQMALRYGALPDLRDVWPEEKLYDPERDYIAELQIELGLAKRSEQGRLEVA